MTDESSWTSPSGPAPGPAPAPDPAAGRRPVFVPTGGQQWGPTGTPVHKPGIVPLRPLRLGDMFDGAFTAMRQNPRSMIGMAAVVMTWFLLLPTAVSIGLAAAGRLGAVFSPEDFTTTTTSPGDEPAAQDFPLALVMGYVGQLLAALAVLLVTGLVVHVVAQAVLGNRVTTSQAWAAVRGRVLRLLGLTVLSWLMLAAVVLVALAVGLVLGVVVGPAVGVLVGLAVGAGGAVLAFVVWVRYFVLAPAALVLEGSGVVGSLKRAGVLSKGQFWRILGISLLAQLVAGFASSLLSMPFSIGGMLGGFVVPESWAGIVYVLGTYLGMLVSYSLATPFTAAVTVLQYVDQRIRKEAFDVQLIAGSAGPAPAGAPGPRA